jgi:hypothetical protein
MFALAHAQRAAHDVHRHQVGGALQRPGGAERDGARAGRLRGVGVAHLPGVRKLVRQHLQAERGNVDQRVVVAHARAHVQVQPDVGADAAPVRRGAGRRASHPQVRVPGVVHDQHLPRPGAGHRPLGAPGAVQHRLALAEEVVHRLLGVGNEAAGVPLLRALHQREGVAAHHPDHARGGRLAGQAADGKALARGPRRGARERRARVHRRIGAKMDVHRGRGGGEEAVRARRGRRGQARSVAHHVAGLVGDGRLGAGLRTLDGPRVEAGQRIAGAGVRREPEAGGLRGRERRRLSRLQVDGRRRRAGGGRRRCAGRGGGAARVAAARGQRQREQAQGGGSQAVVDGDHGLRGSDRGA